MEVKTTKIARINEVDIVIIENGEKRVAIKPICEALGIDVDSQRKKLNEDPILSSVTVLSTATGGDGKQYQMVTIPFMFAFGWLFRIDSRNVKEEAREAVLKYQVECYKALYNHFTSYSDFVEQKQNLIDEALTEYENARDGYKDAHSKMKDAEKRLKEARMITFEDFDLTRRQLKMFTDEEMGKISKE